MFGREKQEKSVTPYDYLSVQVLFRLHNVGVDYSMTTA